MGDRYELSERNHATAIFSFPPNEFAGCMGPRNEMEKLSKTKLIMSKTDGIYRYVAVEGDVDDWACYYDKKTKNLEEVKRWGDKINETRARKMFPEFNHLWWRP